MKHAVATVAAVTAIVTPLGLTWTKAEHAQAGLTWTHGLTWTKAQHGAPPAIDGPWTQPVTISAR